MNNTALLILDMQTGNFSAPNPIYQGNDLLTRVHSLINKARTAQVPLIYIQNTGKQGDPDEYGTAGWNIHPSITPKRDDVVIHKSTPDGFHTTPLQQALTTRNVTKLVIAAS